MEIRVKYLLDNHYCYDEAEAEGLLLALGIYRKPPQVTVKTEEGLPDYPHYNMPSHRIENIQAWKVSDIMATTVTFQVVTTYSDGLQSEKATLHITFSDHELLSKIPGPAIYTMVKEHLNNARRDGVIANGNFENFHYAVETIIYLLKRVR